MVMQRLLLSLALVSFSAPLFSVDPLSRVSIKSLRASTSPLEGHKDYYLVRYQGKVNVELADKTKMTGNQLDIVMHMSKLKSLGVKKEEQKVPAPAQVAHPVAKAAANKPVAAPVVSVAKSKPEETFRSIKMIGDVVINRLNHTVKADEAKIEVDKKICIAQGRVSIVQKKHSEKDIPVALTSNRAELDLASEKLLLLGSAQEPVSTVIEFDKAKAA